jgi:P4 family phage/plasmid primase-like protien
MTTEFVLSIGKSDHYAEITSELRLSWPEIRDYFSKPPVETEEKGTNGWYCFASYRNKHRHGDNFLQRFCITLDYDRISSFDYDEVLEDLESYEHIAYTTWSHTPEKPRLRVILPLSRPVDPIEFELISRHIADQLGAGIDLTARESHKPAQFMFLPEVKPDDDSRSNFYFRSHEGSWVDVEEILQREYFDWTERSEWPDYAQNPDAMRLDKAEDPRQKRGIVGDFCRVFGISDAIERFDLPYEQAGAAGDSGSRYTYTNGSRPEGAVVYDEDTKLHSHHDSDPAAGQHNAFDLVRLHRFGHLDAGIDVRAAEITDLPSFKAMAEFARDLEEVAEAVRAAEFDDLGDLSPEEEAQLDADVVRATEGKRITFERLVELIKENASKGKKQCDLAITVIAAGAFSPADTEMLVGHLRENWYSKATVPSKKSLVDSIKSQARRNRGQQTDENGETPDLQQLLIQQVLDEHYGRGEFLKRVGRQFWQYYGGVWRPVADEIVKGKLQRTVVHLRQERKQDMAKLIAAVGESKTSAIVGELFPLMIAYVAEKDDTHDPLRLRQPGPAIVNCRNGEIVFHDENGISCPPRLVEHSPGRFLTSQVPIEYDPSAKCPEWDRFCGLVFPKEHRAELQRHMEELGGYLIQHSRWLKTWVLFHGASNAGKTTIGNVFNALLDNAAVQRAMHAYDGRNSHAEAGLVGKLMLIDEDFTKGEYLPDGFIKRVSEEKAMTANPKSKDEFNFRSRALPIVISNHWPMTKDVSDALRNRALVFDFETAIPAEERSDERQKRMLTEELPGIFARFVKGFDRLRRRGDWLLPEPCVEARRRWTTRSNNVAAYMEEMIEVTSDNADRIPTADLWQSYRAWQRDAGSGNFSLGKVEFFERVDKLLGTRLKYRGVQIYTMCRFKTDEALDDDTSD